MQTHVQVFLHALLNTICIMAFCFYNLVEVQRRHYLNSYFLTHLCMIIPVWFGWGRLCDSSLSGNFSLFVKQNSGSDLIWHAGSSNVFVFVLSVFERYKSYSPYDMKESIRKEVKGDLEKSFLTLGKKRHIRGF